MRIWAEPFTHLRLPKIFNLRTDPYERADITSDTYYDWLLDHANFVAIAIAMATAFLDTFREFPPRHEPASFTIDQAVRKLEEFLAQGLMLRLMERRAAYEVGDHRLRRPRPHQRLRFRCAQAPYRSFRQRWHPVGVRNPTSSSTS